MATPLRKPLLTTISAEEARGLAEQANPDAHDLERLLIFCGIEIRDAAADGYFSLSITLNCDKPMLEKVVKSLRAQNFEVEMKANSSPATRIVSRELYVTW